MYEQKIEAIYFLHLLHSFCGSFSGSKRRCLFLDENVTVIICDDHCCGIMTDMTHVK